MDVDVITSAVERRVKAKMMNYDGNGDPTEALASVVYLLHLGVDLSVTPETPGSLKQALSAVSREMMARQELILVNG